MKGYLLPFAIIVSLLFPWRDCLAGESNLEFFRLTSENGLSNSAVNCIFQDSRGRMWFGTWDGLDMFDGKYTKVFKPDPSDPNTISNNIIRGIVEQTRDVLWVATDKGINRLDVRASVFRRYFTDLDIAHENSFHLAADPSGSIYAFVDGHGCYRYDEASGSFISVFPVGKNVNVFFDSHYGLWSLGVGGDLKRCTINSSGEVSSYSLVGESVRNVTIDREGKRVVACFADGGISVTDYPYTEWRTLLHYSDVRFLSFLDNILLFADGMGLKEYDANSGLVTEILEESRIMSICSGTQGVLWIGTDMNGVVKVVDRRHSDFSSYPARGKSLFGGSAVRSFCETGDGLLLAGTKGSGIFVCNPAEGKISGHIVRQDGLADNSVYVMEKDADGTIWIGTEGKGLDYYDGTRVRSLDMAEAQGVESVYSILPLGGDTLFVGTAGKGMFKLVISDGKVMSWSKTGDCIVYSLLRLDSGTVLVGTRGRGVYRYDVEEGTAVPLSESISSLDVLSMHLDRKNRLWLGSSTGLYLMDPEYGRIITRLSESGNLPNNTIHAILEDESGCIWISTNNGIGRISEEGDGFRISTYHTADGLYGNEFCDGACRSVGNGRNFCFGNTGGMTFFDPLSISSSSFFPHLNVASFKIDNTDAPLPDGQLTLGGDVNSISFTFTPLDYVNGHRCNMAYRVDGGPENWIETGNAGTVVLNRLKKGGHTLYVRCSNPDGEWGDPDFILPIRVRAMWYASTVAIVIYAFLAALLCGCFFWFVRQRISSSNEIRRRETAHEAKLKFFTDIAHEFSNSLTLIYGPCVEILSNPLIDSATRRHASLIESSSERMRTLIEELIDFRKAETGHLTLHCNEVNLEQLANREVSFFSGSSPESGINWNLEIEKGLVSWKTDNDSLEKMVFNLLSNASKYTPAGENVLLEFRRHSNMLKVIVTNSGTGISKDSMLTIFNRFVVLDRYEKDVSRGKRGTSNGIGLAMCKSLSELLGGSISVDSDGSTFVRFTITIPQMTEPVESVDSIVQQMEWRPSSSAPEKAAVKETEGTEADSRNVPRLLVVDDELQIRRFISELFSKDFNVVCSYDGRSALEEVRKRRPDIIISDIVMPGMGGVELLRELKANSLTRSIPVVLLSARGAVESQIEGLSEGADHYISKPFNPKQLVAVVNSLLNRDKAVIEYSNSFLFAMDMFEGKVLKRDVRDLLTAVTEAVCRSISDENLSVDSIAKQTAVSKIKLYRVIKESMGMTPSQYVREIRIQHSARLLRTTNLTVQEIMYACGFSSKAYFYRIFHESFNKTPKDYRIENQN